MFLPRSRSHGRLGAWNAVLAFLYAILAGNPAAAEPPHHAVWFDGDFACGVGASTDVDDCWALWWAARSGVRIAGISTVFGNAPLRDVQKTATRLVARLRQAGYHLPDPVTGAGKAAMRATPAASALLKALDQQRLTILALGPLTNIAAALRADPAAAKRIERIIFVGGQANARRFRVGTLPAIHVHDLNVRSDALAVRTILDNPAPLVLMPFAAARRIIFTSHTLNQLASRDPVAAWLAEASIPWLRFWAQTFRQTGFFPFDLLAVWYLLDDSAFECLPLAARVTQRRSRVVSSRSTLDVFSPTRRRPARVLYCARPHPSWRAVTDAIQPVLPLPVP